MFESIGGLGLVCGVLKMHQQNPQVLRKCIELFSVYLLEENYVDSVVEGQSIRKTITEKTQALVELLGGSFVSKMMDTINGL